MVGHIDIHRLNLEELAGVVTLYPWYGAARMELGRRIGSAWSPAEFCSHALHVADRAKLASLMRSRPAATDPEAAKPSSEKAPETRRVHVVGGDYFSQTQYDNLKESEDSLFARFTVKPVSSGPENSEATSDLADRFPTETLAGIFAEQGRIEEARRIYSRLILDIPEKSAYFASLIENLN